MGLSVQRTKDLPFISMELWTGCYKDNRTNIRMSEKEHQQQFSADMGNVHIHTHKL